MKKQNTPRSTSCAVHWLQNCSHLHANFLPSKNRFLFLMITFLSTNFLSNAQLNTLSEGFDDITTLTTNGWVQSNLSSPIGSLNWFQGNNSVFGSQSGSVTSYIVANFNNVAGDNTISNWLITPELNVINGATFSFYSRTEQNPAFYPDRLQVRLSTNGASTNIGTTATSVGDFTTVLLEINPTLTATGYPSSWTLYTITITGVPIAISGKIAFRYFVTNGGSGVNSNYIGIDNVTYNSNCTPTTYYLDADADGLGDLANTVSNCVQPLGYVANNTDVCPLVNSTTIGANFGSNGCNCNVGSYPTINVVSAQNVITSCTICPAITFTNTSVKTCAATNTGEISVSGEMGGTTPYMYSLDNGAYQSGSAFLGLTNGNHTIKIKDANGCESAVSTINLDDVTPPTITCPTNITQNNDAGQCDAIVNYTAPVGTDNCAGATTSLFSGYASGSTFPIGITTNVYKVTDASGNSATCSFTVTIIDNEPPTITCPPSISTQNDLNTCGATVTYTLPTFTRCSAPPTCATPYSINGYSDIGVHNGHRYFLSNNAANYNTAKAAAIATGGHLVSINDVAENNFMQASAIAINQEILIGYTDAINEGTFVWDNGDITTYTNWGFGEPNNNAGNEDYSLIAPSGLWNDFPLSSALRYAVEFDCAYNSNLVQIAGLPSGSVFPNGTTVNTFLVYNSNGIASTCSFNVVVADTSKPTITSGANITVNNATGLCGKVVNFTQPIATDNCGFLVNPNESFETYTTGDICAQNPSWIGWPGGYPCGAVVNSLASNGSNSLFVSGTANYTSASQDFTYAFGNIKNSVVDVSFKMFVNTGSSANFNIEHTKAAEWAYDVQFFSNSTGAVRRNGGFLYFNYPQNTWFDVHQAINQSTDQVTLTINGFVIGTWPFSKTQFGANGINKLDVINFFAQTSTILADPNPSAPSAFYIDELKTIVRVIQIAGLPSGSVFPVGTTTNTFKTTDASGNFATTSFNVTVVDAENPIITTCPTAFTGIANTAGCTYTGSIGVAPLGTDNCGIVSNTFLPVAPYPRGVTTVTHTVVDASGNTTTCTQLVTINPAPVIVIANSATTLFSNDQLNLEIVTPSSGSAYAWAGQGGLASSTTDLIEYITSANTGTYTASATDAVGCTNSTTIDITVSASAVLQLKALLSGPYITSASLMQDSLRVKNLIPTTEPYSAAPYSPIFAHASNNNAGMACTEPSLLGSASATTGANAIVDWVFVQLRNAADSNIVLASRSALIQRDGDVVREDGVRPVTFQGIVPGNYFVSIKHRTHIGIMSFAPINITEAGTSLDFTNTSTALYSRAMPNNNATPLSGQTRILGGKRALYTGNCNIATTPYSRFITYNNSLNSDRTTLVAATGASGTITGYSILDLDMNGYARFNGLNPDRLILFTNCANSSTTYVQEQTPN